jgi:hypothetical protein
MYCSLRSRWTTTDIFESRKESLVMSRYDDVLYEVVHIQQVWHLGSDQIRSTAPGFGGNGGFVGSVWGS